MSGDPVANLVARLESGGYEPRPAGPDSWESLCPAHKGSRRNLSVSRGDDGLGVEKARGFLREVVGPAPIRARDVFRQAEDRKISERTLRRAKARDRIESVQLEGDLGWWWRYPSGSHEARLPECQAANELPVHSDVAP
jgi:hypothetical protein